MGVLSFLLGVSAVFCVSGASTLPLLLSLSAWAGVAIRRSAVSASGGVMVAPVIGAMTFDSVSTRVEMSASDVAEDRMIGRIKTLVPGT